MLSHIVTAFSTSHLEVQCRDKPPALAYMLVVRPEVGTGMGIWIIPDSQHTHATHTAGAGRKWNSRQILGLARVAIRSVYNPIRICKIQLIT